MIIIQKDILFKPVMLAPYPINKLVENPEKALFIDIETTGFSAKTSKLYLIGCAYYEQGSRHLAQWFADKKDDEEEILNAFLMFASTYDTLIHFNGNRFDLPYIKAKCDHYGIEDQLDNMNSIDIYKLISPYKDVLGLENCKQKTIELFLGINREDIFTGGQLIEIYDKYLESKNEEFYRLLLLHNEDDVKGMSELLPILYYVDFFESIKNMPPLHMRTDAQQSELSDTLPLRAVKVQANYYTDMDGTEKKEIFMKLSLSCNLPVPFKCNLDGIFLNIEGNTANLRIPLFEEELKYFYSNYKDYYYLPDEDQALHKSVASFVERSHRVQAKAENCYTRKPGQFLKQWDLVFTPFFKHEYKEHALYFELTDNIKVNRSAMSLYACHVLSHLFE
jgi:uncharacterized protein YprB with RNaseH-like and TPR domain